MSLASENPLSDARFRRLFSAQVIALSGTGLSTVALTLLAYDLRPESAALVLGSALFCKMIAYVVFAPIVGGLAHRFSRRPFLVTMDVVRALVVLCMPFVSLVWQVYVLVFVLNLLSAGFKPVFAATIPDILPDERRYTRALAQSRLAYDLENLASPILAGVALLVMSHSGLFVLNSCAFVVSAILVVTTALPQRTPLERSGGIYQQVTFGLRAYLKTPRLRGLLSLYLAVAGASSMVIVNTVVYVRQSLGLGETEVALGLAASGGGSMIAALAIPRVLERTGDRRATLAGGIVMALGLACFAEFASLGVLFASWFLVGVGWSLVQTPAGRIVNRSCSAEDRPAYFSAQFALSHLCWLLFYPVAGLLGTRFGVQWSAWFFAFLALWATWVASVIWPAKDQVVLEHEHEAVTHTHWHVHDAHHSHGHEHDGHVPGEPHCHPHTHAPIRHAHPFVIDDHHTHWPRAS